MCVNIVSITFRAQRGVSGAVNGSGTTISQTLTATGGGTGTVIYTITPAFEDCTPIPIEVVVTVQPLINFDVTSTNWGILTTASAWESHFMAQTGTTTAIISNFSLVGGRVRFSVSTDAGRLNLDTRNITTVSIINIPTILELSFILNTITIFDPTILPSNLQRLDLLRNTISNFNPSVPLPSTLLVLNLQVNSIVNFNPTLPLPSNLERLTLQSNNIVTFNPSIPLPSTLKTLNLADNNIVTFNPSIPLPSSLESLSLNVNDIVTFNPSIALPNSLQELFLNANDIVAFNPTLALPSSLQVLELQNNKITVSSWNTATSWIALAPDNGTLVATDNIPALGITGTNTETMLLAKGWTIIP